MRRLLVVLLLVLSSSSLFARGNVHGWAERGGQTVVTNGSVSTTKVQASYPGATYTVYKAGTINLATIYSDVGGTAKANPSTASSTAYFSFWTDEPSVDVSFSGGGISTPFTVNAIIPSTGITGVAMGGTGSDLSTTGPGYLYQSVVGGAVRVGALPFINVKDAPYSAVGDGTTDDTAAIQAAINAAAPSGVVDFGNSAYKITTGLTVPNGVTLRSSNRAVATTQTLNTTAAIVMLTATGTAGETKGITLDNISLNGGGVATDGIVLGSLAGSYTYFNVLRNVYISGVNNGITINKGTYTTITDLRVYGNNVAGTTGVFLPGLQGRMTIDGLEVTHFGKNISLYGTGLILRGGESYAEPQDSNTTRLLYVVDGMDNHFHDYMFEDLRDGSGAGGQPAIPEVEIEYAATHTFKATGNKFFGCQWNGTNALSTRINLGVGGNTVGKTLFRDCVFSQGGTTDIALTNAANTLILDSYRITGYDGTEIGDPRTTGTDTTLNVVNASKLSVAGGKIGTVTNASQTAGDAAFGRPGAPTTGAIWLGNTGAYIYYSGTKFAFGSLISIPAGLSTYANNAAALAGGLVAGDLYTVTGSDPRQAAIVY